MRLKLSAVLLLLAFTSGCTNIIYQGQGFYLDQQEQEKQVVLQWKAQKYYIPFIPNKVEYGSVSLQAECIDDLLLDHVNHEQHGLIFLERPNDFSLAQGSPEIRIDNYIVCAQLQGGISLADMSIGDELEFLVYCEAKDEDSPILPVNLDGYGLQVLEMKSEPESNMQCSN